MSARWWKDRGDRRLLELVARDDVRALDAIVRRHLEAVFAAATASSRDRHEATTITYEVFCEVWRERQAPRSLDGCLEHRLVLSAHRRARGRGVTPFRFDNLSEPEHDVFALAHQARLSISEIAAVLRISPKAAKDRLHDALASI